MRRKGPRVRCVAQMHGGGHERGMRSGTLNVPAIAGLGQAVTLAVAEMDQERRRLAGLRDRLETELLAGVDGLRVNGRRNRRLANTTNVSIEGIEADELMKRVPEIAMSTSAACTSATRLPSYVLGAMGLSADAIRGSIRISIGRFTTEAEIGQATERLLDCVVTAR